MFMIFTSFEMSLATCRRYYVHQLIRCLLHRCYAAAAEGTSTCIDAKSVVNINATFSSLSVLADNYVHGNYDTSVENIHKTPSSALRRRPGEFLSTTSAHRRKKRYNTLVLHVYRRLSFLHVVNG